MDFSKLWQRYFTQNDEATEIALHMAGATSRSHNPFEQLAPHRNQDELTEEFIEDWVISFYGVSLTRLDDATVAAFARAASRVTPDIVRQLLGDFDWRPRIVGAYFAAIKGYAELTDTMGVHLLQSEVCYAGAGYALALASFGSAQAKGYLQTYLDYYLEQPALWYDQAAVLAALYLLDPAAAATYQPAWLAYTRDKPYHQLVSTIDSLHASLAVVQRIRATSGQ